MAHLASFRSLERCLAFGGVHHCNLCVLGISIFAVGSQSGLWSGARVGECLVVLQEMVNMCGCHRILWLFVHAADEAISSFGLFALSSEARSFIAVDF